MLFQSLTFHQPCSLSQIKLVNGDVYSCPESCTLPRLSSYYIMAVLTDKLSSDETHEYHTCNTRMCPVSCQLCTRLCSNLDHLHGLEEGEQHLCELVFRILIR